MRLRVFDLKRTFITSDKALGGYEESLYTMWQSQKLAYNLE